MQLSAMGVLAVVPAAHGLEPADVAVLYNTRSANSLQIARYYMEARKIPANQLIPINCTPADDISEEDYQKQVIPQLLKELGDRKLLPDEKAGIAGIKCLVTTYGMPLRVQAHALTAAEKAEVSDCEKKLDVLVADLEKTAAAFEAIAPPGNPGPATAPSADRPAWQQAANKAVAAAVAAGPRVEKLPDAQRLIALNQFVALQEHLSGIGGVLSSVRVPANAPDDDPGRRHLAELAGQFRELQAQYQVLSKQLDSARVRRELIDIRLKGEGVLGEARARAEVIAYLQPAESHSCFDNELSLALADQSYNRANWQSNPKYVEAWPTVQRLPKAQVPPTVMVSRIDGSSVAKAKETVDLAIQVEAKGLEGKIYLDARGLHGTDGYASFDADIRRAAEWLKDHASMETVLDDRPELFVAKDCPDAAVYCGWYSLRNYQDSCQWVKGAVGYHVASFEMASLHNPGETGWVVNLLNHGFAGTLGATDEPFLNAFPKPSLFIPLLLSGEFTQGEVWQVTSPMVSWRVGFVGDPLYNPFKAKPRVKVADIKQHTVLRNAYEILGR